MSKRIRITVFALVAVLIFASISWADVTPSAGLIGSGKDKETETETEKETEKKDEDKKKEKKEDTRPQGTQKGEAMGAIDGEQAAIQDYYMGAKSNAKGRLPKDSQITKTYDLKRQQSTFRVQFIRAYRAAYLKHYEFAFSEASIKKIQESKERAWASGEALGIAEGAVAAYYDLMNNYRKDWLKSYNTFIKQKSLEERYKLDKNDSDHLIVFINSFRRSYRSSYNEQYETFVATEAMNGTNFHTVSYFEDTTIYDSLYGLIDKGAPTISSQTTAALSFERGTVYQDSIVGFTRNENLKATKDYYTDTASGVYQVTVRDPKGYVKLYKPITLSFVYGGNPGLGVYKWDTSRWLYLPTEIGEGGNGIGTQIPAGNYSGGKYAVFIDENVKVPKDIYYNWAFDDIYLSLRRHFISGQYNFRPNQSITRYELAELLYRMLYFRRDKVTYHGEVADNLNLSMDKSVLDFVLGHGIMKLDPANNFNPNKLVNYADFERIVATADKGNHTFDFQKIADKMYYEKLHLSGYTSSGQNNVSRAEVVYTLNKVFD